MHANRVDSWNGNRELPSGGEVLAALDRLAERTGRSRNWLVARAVEDFAAINEWQLPKIEAGIAAADRKDFASDEEMARIWTKFGVKREIGDA